MSWHPVLYASYMLGAFTINVTSHPAVWKNWVKAPTVVVPSSLSACGFLVAMITYLPMLYNSVDRAEIIKELKKCAESPAYFINTYVNVVHPVKGVVPFALFPFQERMIGEIHDNRFTLVRKFRQAGITTLTAAYSLWTIIFEDHKNVMVVSIGDRESRAFLERVVMMFDDLPKWLQPVEVMRNKHTLKLSTGSQVKSQPAGAGRGESVSLLIVDEAAFVDKMREFWMAIYPTISTGGKACLVSTVNGMSNLYYELYKSAEKEENKFYIVDIKWREHPWYTDEWYEETRPNMSEKAWLQEYECQFLGTGDTFIDRHTLGTIQGTMRDDWTSKYTHRMRVWEEPKPYYNYILAADASYGRERDHSAFHVINLYNGQQVAEFYSNVTPISKFAEIIAKEGYHYNTAFVQIERNGLGMALIEQLWDYVEYDNLVMDEKGEFGVMLTTKTREVVLSDLEDALRKGKIKINSERTFNELITFIINEDTGKVEADEGYTDDLVMSLALAAHTFEVFPPGSTRGGSQQTAE